MSLLKDELEKQIRKLILPLKSEEVLTDVLKKRLTKKEYKLLLATAEGVDENAIAESIHLTQEDYEKLKAKLTKKLNQEKLKQELMV